MRPEIRLRTCRKLENARRGNFDKTLVAKQFSPLTALLAGATRATIDLMGHDRALRTSFRRLFIFFIATLQLFGGVIFFSYFTNPQAQPIDARQQFFIISTLAIYLIGFVGSIVIWVRPIAGIWISIIHQAFQVPFFVIPSLHYILGSYVNLLLFVTWSNDNPAHQLGFDLSIITIQSLISWLNVQPGTTYYGFNAIAVGSLVFLLALLFEADHAPLADPQAAITTKI
jgi:hypothetical protein